MKIKNKYRLIFTLCILTLSSVQPIYSSFIDNSTKINILMPAPFADSTKDLIDQFNKENKGDINIKVIRGPRETESVSDLAISSLLLGNSPFDILMIDITWLPKYAAAGWLAPMDRYISKRDWDSLAVGAKLGNSYKQNLYRWPMTSDMGLLFWRKDLMENPPTTPIELIRIAKNLVEEGKVSYGYVWQGRQYEGLSCVFLEVINGFGGEWINESSEVKLSSKESIQAVSWLKNLIETGITPRAVTNFSENEALQAFKSGEAALMRNWPYAWAELQKESSIVKGKIGVSTMVAVEGEQPTSTLGSWGLSILSSSKNKEVAYEVISYLTSLNSQKELFVNYGYTPTNSQIFNDKKLREAFPVLVELQKALEQTKPRPEIPLYAQVSDVLQRQLSEVFTNDKNIKEAMLKAERNTNQILLSAGESK